MLRNTTALPDPSRSLRHVASAGESSALAQASVDKASSAGSTIKPLSSKTQEAIQRIVDDSIRNHERIDSLMHSIGLLTGMKEDAVREKAQLVRREVAFKQRLETEIHSLAEKAKGARNEISNVSEQIQSLEKKQEKQARLASEREAEFHKHFVGYKGLLEGHATLAGKKASLSAKSQELQQGMDAKKAEVSRFENKLKSLDGAIRKALEAGVDEAYEEVANTTSALVKKHGKQIASESSLEEVTAYLCSMTEQPKTKAERIKDVESKHKLFKYATYIAGLTVMPACIYAIYRQLEPYQAQLNALASRQPTSLRQQVRLQEQLQAAEAAMLAKSSELTAVLVVAGVLAITVMAAARIMQQGSMRSEIARIKVSDDGVLHRSIKSGMINTLPGPPASAEEALFKLAFGLAQHANMKLLRSPLELMTKEVTRLVMDAKINGTAIDRGKVDSGRIQEYIGRFKGVLKKENERLEKKLDAEIEKFSDELGGKGKKKIAYLATAKGIEQYIDFLGLMRLGVKTVPEKVELLKRICTDETTKAPVDQECKAVVDMAAKAEFISEFSKLFNGGNEAMLADGIRNMVGSMAEDMLQKWSSDGASTSDAVTSSFERRIKDVDRQQHSLGLDLKQARSDLMELVHESEKLDADIKGVDQEIRSNDDEMIRHKRALESIRLPKDQLAAYKAELGGSGVRVEHQGEHTGLSAAKARHVKNREKEDAGKMAVLLETHDALHVQYADLQAARQQKEDELARATFLENSASSGKDDQIRKIDEDIHACQSEADALRAKEKALLNSIEGLGPLREILTPNAIRRVKQRHLAQSEHDLKTHADRNGYSSNYKSVGHFLKACLDTHAAFHEKIDESGTPELQGFFARSEVDVADGMDKLYRGKPIAASVSNFVEAPDPDGKKFLIDHIYGYVPRG